jgi:glycosyltransferase involved in cell wall biosynthesis
MNPKISIVVPIYKVPEDFLRECINSLVCQTYRNIEIVLVNDGSPDDSGKRCDEYAQKDNRIRVIHKPNGGLVSARNAGFDAITGDWHMYLDGDDWIDTDTCEELSKVIKRYPDTDVIFWKFFQEMKGKSVKSKMDWACAEDEHLYEGQECHELARNTMIYSSGLTTAYAKLINTQWAKENGIRHDDRLRQGEEGVEFTLRLFYNARKALYLNKYWNHYRYTEGSITKQVNEKNTAYITDCFKVMEEDIEKFENRDAVKRMFYQRVVYGLIAIAFSTYFHPDNKEPLSVRLKKYKDVIDDTDIYKTAIKRCPLEKMDKFRVITLYFMKTRMFFMLQIVSEVKQFMLRRGHFSY